MRILFLSPYPPSLIRVRPFNWIKHLAARGHQITLLALVSSAQEAADLKQVARYCQSRRHSFSALAPSLEPAVGSAPALAPSAGGLHQQPCDGPSHPADTAAEDL